MKVIITALSIAFLIGSAVAEYEKWLDDNGYNDHDAYYLAQYNSGVGDLHPGPYHTFHRELEAIRLKNPELKDIHHQPWPAAGKVYLTNYDLDAIHKSSFGPITAAFVNRTNGLDTYLVTFPRPYLINPLMYDLAKYHYGPHNDYDWNQVKVTPWVSSVEWVQDKDGGYYVFTKYDECLEESKCDHKKDKQYVVDTPDLTTPTPSSI